MPRTVPVTLAIIATILAVPLAAKDDLGVFGNWGAFRDGDVPRCYAIAQGEDSSRRRDFTPFASVSTWPRREVRGQVYFRLSRPLAAGSAITLRIGGESFTLVGSGNNAWASGAGMDAQIVAAMRAASRMSVNARDNAGNRFSDSFSLTGAATAMDAASVGCARRTR